MARKALGLGSTYQGGTGFFYRVAAGIYQAGIEDGIALRAKTNMPLPDPALSRQILGPEINNFDRALRLYMPPGGAKDTLDPMRFVVKAAAMEEYLDQATPDDMLPQPRLLTELCLASLRRISGHIIAQIPTDQ